jgi:hypothetical protein
VHTRAEHLGADDAVEDDLIAQIRVDYNNDKYFVKVNTVLTGTNQVTLVRNKPKIYASVSA